ncbi:MAG: cytochrome c3 family protein [Deltaproteobacteria bacterium]|nr:cytochrome c3 family protein [Deltaproteobacteria bacterium]
MRRVGRLRKTRLVTAASLLYGLVSAEDNVQITKHNLRNVRQIDGVYTAIADFGEICVYCHTPHSANEAGGVAPIWNKNLNAAGSYTLYGSPTLDTRIGPPTGVSLICLSCHDGTIGLDVIVNQPGVRGDEGGFAPSGTLMRDTGDPSFNPRLGQDLSDDHPVSMRYAGPGGANVDPQFHGLATVKAAGLKFFGGASPEDSQVVECATCHNPHEARNEKFLRIRNVNSNLCKTCHIK